MKFTASATWLAAAKASAKTIRWRFYIRKVTDISLALSTGTWVEISNRVDAESWDRVINKIEEETGQFSADTVKLRAAGITWWKAQAFNLTADQYLELKVQMELGLHGTYAADECIVFSGFVDTRPNAITYRETTDTVEFTTLTAEDLGSRIKAENITVQYTSAGKLILKNMDALAGVGPFYYLSDDIPDNLLLNGGFDLFEGLVEEEPATSASFESWTVDDTGGKVYVAQGPSVKFLRTGAGDLFIRQNITGIIPEVLHTITFQYGNDVSTGLLEYEVYDVTHGADLITKVQVPDTGGSFIQFTNTFTPPAGCTEIRITFHAPSTSNERAYVDEVYVYGTGANTRPLTLGEHVITAKYDEQTGLNVWNLDGGKFVAMQDGENIVTDSPDGSAARATQVVLLEAPANIQDAFLPQVPIKDYLVVKEIGELPWQWPYNVTVESILSDLYTLIGITTQTFGTLELAGWRTTPVTMFMLNARYAGKTVTEAINETLLAFFLMGAISATKKSYVYARALDDGTPVTTGNTLAVTTDHAVEIEQTDGLAEAIFVDVSNGTKRMTYDGTDWNVEPVSLVHRYEYKSELIPEDNVQDLAYRKYQFYATPRQRLSIPLGIFPRFDFEPFDALSVTFTGTKILKTASGPITAVEYGKDGSMAVEVLL